MRLLAVFIGLCALVILPACSAEKAVEVKYRGFSMGTTWIVKVNSIGGYSTELALEIQAELDKVDTLMSNWKETSDVSRFNRSEINSCTDVSKPTLTVISTSQKVAQLSDGAFDISLAPLIELWGFGTKSLVSAAPTEEQIAAELAQMGVSNIRFTETQLCKNDVPLQLNLSGLAKGYAVDQVAKLLTQKGLTDYLVEVGGELRAQGKNGRGTYWTVGIEQPANNLEVTAVQTALPLLDQAVATSGDYRNFYEVDEIRYSHIIDPVSGYPVTHNAASVTVLSKSSMVADAWATALLVLGPERGLEIAEQQGLPMLMILRVEDGFSLVTSKDWPQS